MRGYPGPIPKLKRAMQKPSAYVFWGGVGCKGRFHGRKLSRKVAAANVIVCRLGKSSGNQQGEDENEDIAPRSLEGVITAVSKASTRRARRELGQIAALRERTLVASSSRVSCTGLRCRCRTANLMCGTVVSAPG